MDEIAGALTAAGATWFWEGIGKELAAKAAGTIKDEWKRFHWPEAEERYRSRLREQYRFTRLLGNPKPIEIENIYTDVYVLDQLTAIRRYTIEQIEETHLSKGKFSFERENRIPILSLIDKKKRLYLLGRPGAGKTTFLKYLVIQACAGKIKETPIFVELKDLASSSLNLMEYIAHQFEICAFPDASILIKYLLEHGYAFVLFDGLDEVNQEGEQRSSMIRKLRDFARQYPLTQIVISCRNAASEYSFEEFTYIEIANFSENQIQQYVRKWYQDEPVKGERFLEELIKPEHRGLKELSSTPLLLALLCLAFDQTLAFPSNRTELYKEALDALLKKWDASRNVRRDKIYQKLTPVRRENMLARIAALNFEKHTYLIPDRILAKQITSFLEQISEGGLLDDIDGEEVLKAIEAQHGILVERAHGIYSFSHLTIQEYLTALYIVQNERNGSVESLINLHHTDNRWREVFLMTATLLDDASNFFEIFHKAVFDVPQKDKTLIKMMQWAFKNAQLSPLSNEISQKVSCFLILLIYAFTVYHEKCILASKNPRIPKSLSKSRFNLDDLIDPLNLASHFCAPKSGTKMTIYSILLSFREKEKDVPYALYHVEKSYKETIRSIQDPLEKELKFYYKIDPQSFMGELDLVMVPIKAFTCYVNASRLLIDCLEYANVPDRESIIDRTFSPPTE